MTSLKRLLCLAATDHEGKLNNEEREHNVLAWLSFFPYIALLVEREPIFMDHCRGQL